MITYRYGFEHRSSSGLTNLVLVLLSSSVMTLMAFRLCFRLTMDSILLASEVAVIKIQTSFPIFVKTEFAKLIEIFVMNFFFVYRER